MAAVGAKAQEQPWAPPGRLPRPELSTDEGGLWGIMDREERNLRRSPFLIRDRKLNDYVQGIACRLAGDHCPDVRVYLVNTPLFNASMAPNGMMQVWSGLLLRVENEAQLAAVIQGYTWISASALVTIGICIYLILPRIWWSSYPKPES